VTVSLREAIRGIRSDRARWLTLLLPVGDGLLIALKAPSKLS
jgi:predicted O-methyltransferase YrrM